ncbi:DUF4870 domain-containing protein [Pseudanabaena sp. FACHB-2040]|uniref:DUF4870 domain-containing protein n=1 Tax=Pseudanabaena sp. FACHB-2040 TaxID=2692859 RepID=UPI00168A2039|nr:DUF4870 domain-containing protein [Pseudanabaena sp. FACHB-2040]MBD2259761.1 DUF4870 domain-containing protein [Pseudanabaena sp. FACHB-2040]
MSSSPETLLQAGAQAMQQARYQDAIEPLEAFCKGSINRRSKQFFQAQMWLVQAYQKNGQDLHAIALCEQLIKSDIPQVQQWGQKVLPKLLKEAPPASQPAVAEAAPEATPEATPEVAPAPEAEAPATFFQVTELLSPEAAAEVFSTGRKALQQRRYDEAAAAFETFIQGADPSYSNYAWACTSLGKAYRGNEQPEKALALCQHLYKSDQESLQAWARDFFKTLDLPDKELVPTSPAPAPTDSEAADFTDPGANPLPIGTENDSLGATPTPKKVKPIIQSGQKDLSPQILSAVAHGSISLLGSVLIALIFRDSIVANLLGLLRFVIPVVILFTAQDAVAKANAKEATNYVITSLVLLAISIPAALFLFPIAIVFGPLLILLVIPLITYCLLLAIWPVVATIVCARDRRRTFRYPRWLILHLL